MKGEESAGRHSGTCHLAPGTRHSSSLANIPLATARVWAEQIRGELAPLCERVEIAGSIRRARELVNDVDLVVLAADDAQRAAVKARCRQTPVAVLANGDVNYIVRLGNGLQVDIFFAHPAEGPAQGNFGSLLLCRTGSRAFNIWFAQQAKGRGLHWNAYRGILRGNALVAGETEEGLFKALGLEWIEPDERDPHG